MAVAEAAAADRAAPRPEEAPGSGSDAGEREMRDLEELLSKLNPMAEEFVPPSLASPVAAGGGAATLAPVPAPLSPAAYGYYPANAGFAVASPGHRGVVSFPAVADGPAGRGRKKGGAGGFGGHGHPGRRRTNSRTSMAQRDEVIRRTVYVSDIDHQVTEENLAALFINCGQVVDCRMCGDPNSVLRFAFIEFTDEEGARAALNLSGTVLGYYPVRVLPSKTAIAPVNPTFLPRSDDEREMCARTIYCTNIDKKVTQADLKLFFESICGEVFRLRLLGDYHHSTRIAFVEFVMRCDSRFLANKGVSTGKHALPPTGRPPRSAAPATDHANSNTHYQGLCAYTNTHCQGCLPARLANHQYYQLTTQMYSTLKFSVSLAPALLLQITEKPDRR
ncbi:uncharacterized protein C2845_PM13G01330 [Panicum miliaceum]|uniref:RRM domain-containing protein n=1 Tax=Panicum miliaceum TaxID=4540 RepID=A0A3L6RM46_PANMI|nr:uncharacterized protein C2845_PM13G01330 [Panicum miliaceum]